MKIDKCLWNLRAMGTDIKRNLQCAESEEHIETLKTATDIIDRYRKIAEIVKKADSDELGYEYIGEKITEILVQEKQNNMTSSHDEKEIYKGCIDLMSSLTGKFYEWLDFIGVDVSKLDEEERFCANYHPTEIVERLFLWKTSHSGGTSQRMKCNELGVDAYGTVSFDFSEELENEE